MPGFIINANENNAAPTTPKNSDWLRTHRFKLSEFFGVRLDANEFLSVKDVKLPDKSMSDLKISTPGTTYSFAKQASYSDLEITFYGSEDVLLKCLQFADKVHDVREGLHDYNDYKGSVSIKVFTDGNGKAAVEYKYINAYISSVKHSQLTYTSSEIYSISLVIKFDYYDVVSRSLKIVDSNNSPNSLIG